MCKKIQTHPSQENKWPLSMWKDAQHHLSSGKWKLKPQWCATSPASQGALVVKNLPANARDVGSIPGLGRSPGGGRGNPLQHSCLENPCGQRSRAGYKPQGRKESDTTETTVRTTSHLWEILKKTRNTKCSWCGAKSYAAPRRFSWLFLWIECRPCLHTVTIFAESLSYPHGILWSMTRRLHSTPIHSWLRYYCCLHHYRKGDWGSEIGDLFFLGPHRRW